MRFLGVALIWILIVGTLFSCHLHQAQQVSRGHAEHEVEKRGLHADQERHYGPIRLRAPRGFRPQSSGSSDFNPIHWTGRGANLTLWLGQYTESGLGIADRFAAELRLWIPAPGTAGAEIVTERESYLRAWAGELQPTRVSNDAGMVAVLYAPASMYSESDARRLLAEVLSSIRIDGPRMSAQVEEFRRQYAERHAAVLLLEGRLSRDLGIVFAERRQPASEAFETYHDNSLRDGFGRGGSFTRDQRIYVLCRVTPGLSALEQIAARLPRIARAVPTPESASYYHSRVLIAVSRSARGESEGRLLWRSPRREDEAEFAYGDDGRELRRHMDDFDDVDVPVPVGGAFIYAVSDNYSFVDDGDVAAASEFVADVKGACGAPADDASRPPPLGITVRPTVPKAPPPRWLAWYERTPQPQTLSAVLAIEHEARAYGNRGYLMVADGELCAAMEAAHLACDYSTRYGLVQFLIVNGKPIRGIEAMYTYIGEATQNRRLTDAIQRNLPLFENDLTSEEVRERWH